MTTPVRDPSLPREGDVVAGRFDLVRFVGAGAASAVYEAIDRFTQTRVALKLFTGSTPEEAAGVAEALRRVDHPRVVRYVANGREALPWLAMEWLDGQSVASRLASGPLDLVLSLEIVQAIAGAIASLHHRGAWHGAVAPTNVHLEIGSAPGQCGARLLEPSALHGAVGPDAGAAADVRALGALLFACVAGRAPTRAGERASDVRPAIPASLDDLTMKLMSAEGDLRRGVAALNALAAVEPQVRAAATRPEPSITPGNSAEAAVAVPSAATGATPAATPRRGAGLWIGLAVGSVALAGAGVATALVVTRQRGEATASSSSAEVASTKPSRSKGPPAGCGAGCTNAGLADPRATDLVDVLAVLEKAVHAEDPTLERIAFSSSCVAGGLADVESDTCGAGATFVRRAPDGSVVAYTSATLAGGWIIVTSLDPATAPKESFSRTTPKCRSKDAAAAAAKFAPQSTWSGTVTESIYAKTGGFAAWEFGRSGEASVFIDGETCGVALDVAKPPPPPVKLPFAVGELVVLMNEMDTALVGVVVRFKDGERAVGVIPGKSSVEVHVARFPRKIEYVSAGKRLEAVNELGGTFDNSNGKLEIRFGGGPPAWKLKAQSTAHVKGDFATCTAFRSCCLFPSIAALDPADPVNATCRAAEESSTDCARALENVKGTLATASRTPPPGCR